ncbi:MAG: hypothetical protein A2297_04340 [Elusimicrobia bacterium RIFOXYB2_FULL_48_7]|nr:MAG: hypothetical protein A2297_04340 [Elusimicrobia bacterium RIFOXYB2_FULL_48_7]
MKENKYVEKAGIMPLIKGKSRKVISENIKELMDSYKKTGKIGNSTPVNLAKANRQAVAIAYSAANKKR